jgi:DNA-binding MarR family transcriptional regulator
VSTLRPLPSSEAFAAPVRQTLLLLERVHKQLTNTIDGVLLPEQLSLAEWLILSELGIAGQSSLSRIARRLSRDPGSLSRAITHLSRRKLLQSARSGYDRRRTTVSLTSQGHALHERVARAFDRVAWVQPAEALPIERLLALFDVSGKPAAPLATAARTPGHATLPRRGSHAPNQENDS